MKGVFISYVRENTETVDKLCQELKSYSIQVWLDRDDIDPGARWEQAIRKAISQGAFFHCVVSPRNIIIVIRPT